MVVVDEAQVALVEPPFPLDEHPARSVDEDFRDAGIAQEDLQRAEAGEFVDHLFGQAVQFVAGDRQLMARAVFADLFRDVLDHGGARALQQVHAVFVDLVDDVAVQAQLQRLDVLLLAVVEGTAVRTRAESRAHSSAALARPSQDSSERRSPRVTHRLSASCRSLAAMGRAAPPRTGSCRGSSRAGAIPGTTAGHRTDRGRTSG